MPRALRRAAASVQRVQEQQSSLESSVARLEKVARAFVKGHGRQVAQTAAGKQEKAPTEPQMQQMVPGREGRAGGRETELADAAALRGMPKLLLDTARAPAQAPAEEGGAAGGFPGRQRRGPGAGATLLLRYLCHICRGAPL